VAVNIITISKTTKLFLPGGIPNVKANFAVVLLVVSNAEQILTGSSYELKRVVYQWLSHTVVKPRG
jgi:hypothetical protein